MSRPSPLQNRCAPDGSLHAVPERGSLMGNRGGRLHNDDRRLGGSRWRSKAWICCLTEFRSRRREVMGHGYTEIFFLDEVTALAAGHRPCYECRRAAAAAFARAWQAGNATVTPPKAAEIDAVLHRQRLGATVRRAYADVPPGPMFEVGGTFYLRLSGSALAWSFSGYREPTRGFAAGTPVSLLTPAGTSAALGSGYRPSLHPSAGYWSAR